MEIGDWPASKNLNAIYREIRELGMEANLAELEAFGFTVIRDALSPEGVTRARDAIIREAETVHQVKLDLDREEAFRGHQGVPMLLYKDPVFEELALNRRTVAIMKYLLGQNLFLALMHSHLKGPGGIGFPLHTDVSYATPAPYSPYQHIASCNYVLSDYTEEKGAFAVVPGSHRLAHAPTPAEMPVSGIGRNPGVVPVEVPAGSAIIFLGTTWHGSFPRKVPGLRVMVSAAYMRHYMKPLEPYSECVPEGFLERHDQDSLMAQLVGHKPAPVLEKVEDLGELVQEFAATWYE